MPIPEVDKIWFNGELVPWHEAKVHVLTHALHYGSGVFEGIRCYRTDRGPAVFRLTDHLRRMERSAKLYYMQIPYSRGGAAPGHLRRDQGQRAARAATSGPSSSAATARWASIPLKSRVDVAIAAWPWGAYLGEEGIAHGIRAKVASIQSLDHTCLARSAKACGQYLNSILAKVEVTNAGYDEAIMLDDHGHVAEGSGENVFLVRDGKVATPFPSDGVLEGITRDTVLRICASECIPAEERTLTRSDLYVADEAFYTGTAAEIVPIREIDDHPIGEPGPITRRIQERFRAIVEGRDEEFAGYAELVV